MTADGTVNNTAPVQPGQLGGCDAQPAQRSASERRAPLLDKTPACGCFPCEIDNLLRSKRTSRPGCVRRWVSRPASGRERSCTRTERLGRPAEASSDQQEPKCQITTLRGNTGGKGGVAVTSAPHSCACPALLRAAETLPFPPRRYPGRPTASCSSCSSAISNMDLECDICTERFDGAERLPKVLPCGHTACLQCLRRLPDSSCPTCRRDFIGPPEGLPANFLALRMLEGVRLDSTPRCWCSDCRTAPSPRCWDEDHDVLPVKRALRRQLQGALPQAAEQLQGLQDQCREEQALPALTLLTGESWDVTLRGGGRELTGSLRTSEEPLTKALWLLLAARAALTEDRSAARERTAAAASTRHEAAPSLPAAAPTRHAAAPSPPAAAPTPPAAPLAARDPPPAEALPPREMDVNSISCSGPNYNQQEKAAVLRDAPGVTRLVNVWCTQDPAWSLQLLRRAAPTLERLSVDDPSEAHLRAVHAMPRLRRLAVSGDDDLDAQPPELPALPPGHAGLQWLRVENLPRATTQSLLWAHGGTLERLELRVGTPGSEGWPWSCGDLHSLLQQSGLRALRRIVLLRYLWSHEPAACWEQRAEVRRVLPGAEVLCAECDRVEVGKV